MRLIWGWIAGLCILSGPAWSHEFWIEPSDSSPDPGTPLFVRLNLGQGFDGAPFPRTDHLLDRFEMWGPEGKTPVRGLDGVDPAGMVRPVSEGLHVLGYQSHPYRINIEAAEFEAYLLEEGLDTIRMIRHHEGVSDRSVREEFSRSAKSILQVGVPEANSVSEKLGFRIEIIPISVDFPIAIGEVMEVQILFEGKPLEGCLVTALSKGFPEDKRKERTDARGRAAFRVHRSGPWMIKSVHMVPGHGQAEWESFWATLTFEVEEPLE